MNELPPQAKNPDSLNKIEKNRIKILVADDQEDMLNLYLMYLESAGYNVETVKNGQELLDKLAKEKYNLVITDNNMPLVTGIEALEKIRENEELKKMPIILCSATSGDTKEVRKKVEEKGGIFLSKSDFSLDKLQKTVETALSETRDQKIKDKLLALYKSDAYEKVNAEIVARSKYLERKYENLRDYVVFHALVGSSIRGANQDLIEGDLPGNDSIEKFVDDLEKKYKK